MACTPLFDTTNCRKYFTRLVRKRRRAQSRATRARHLARFLAAHPNVIPASEAPALLQVSPSHFYALLRRHGGVPRIKRGHTTLYSLDALQRLRQEAPGRSAQDPALTQYVWHCGALMYDALQRPHTCLLCGEQLFAVKEEM